MILKQEQSVKAAIDESSKDAQTKVANNIASQITNMLTNPNVSDLSNVYKSTVSTVLGTSGKASKQSETSQKAADASSNPMAAEPTAADKTNYSDKYPQNYWTPYMASVVKGCGEDPTSDDGARYVSVLAKQFDIWYLAVPMTFLIVLNWWYLWNYTDFSIDFRQWAKMFPFSLIPHWIVEPCFHSIEFVNYFFVSSRVDSEVGPNARKIMRNMWHYRPITFTIFYGAVAGLLNKFMHDSTVSDFFADLLLGHSKMFAGIIVFASLAFFITLTGARIDRYKALFGSFMYVVIPLVLVLSSVFSSFMGTVIIGILFWFISNLAFLVFTFPGLGQIYAWPWRLLREFLRIYHDLSEAPVNDPESKNIFVKIGNFLFQECQNLFILFVVCLSIMIVNMKEATETFKNNSKLMAAVVILNLLAVFAVSAGMEITLYKLFKILGDIAVAIFQGGSGTGLPTNIPEL